MAKEKLVTIHVHTPFTLTLGDQSKQEFGRGRHNVPEEVASHWFTQAHSELSESVISDTDDLQPIIDSLQAQIVDKDQLIADLKEALLKMQEQNDSLQAQIVDKDQLIADLKEALLKMQEQNDSLQAQIAAAQTGGNGAKDAKEPKPANSK
ncbi:STY1053 family phage-associated protein [Citrobacter braakii]|uniref:STY1053 family phage-associated protein n=1 Tax=Citrobacter braakii TaxID=57706 RepID=UPI003AB61DD0